MRPKRNLPNSYEIAEIAMSTILQVWYRSGSLSANIPGGKGPFPPTSVGVDGPQISLFVWCWEWILSDDYSVLLHTIHASDGRTDRQNCDSNTVGCITCGHAVKRVVCMFTVQVCINSTVSTVSYETKDAICNILYREYSKYCFSARCFR